LTSGKWWQIVPTDLVEMMADPDQAKAKRVADAMLKMVKFDVAALKAAYSETTH
jgi:predicted 3-demethylubiquinone-9 3-methyltransferase (glyoxalase superfamily)